MGITSLFIGFFSGILGGFLGLGGGTLIIPGLVFFLGFNQKLAQGTSLAAMIPPIGLLAAFTYWKTGNVDIKIAIYIAIGFLIGGFFGGTLAQHLPETLLKKGFAIFLIFVAIKIWIEK